MRAMMFLNFLLLVWLTAWPSISYGQKQKKEFTYYDGPRKTNVKAGEAKKVIVLTKEEHKLQIKEHNIRILRHVLIVGGAVWGFRFGYRNGRHRGSEDFELLGSSLFFSGISSIATAGLCTIVMPPKIKKKK